MIDADATKIVMLESEVARLQARVAELEAREVQMSDYIEYLKDELFDFEGENG